MTFINDIVSRGTQWLDQLLQAPDPSTYLRIGPLLSDRVKNALTDIFPYDVAFKTADDHLCSTKVIDDFANMQRFEIKYYFIDEAKKGGDSLKPGGISIIHTKLTATEDLPPTKIHITCKSLPDEHVINNVHTAEGNHSYRSLINSQVDSLDQVLKALCKLHDKRFGQSQGSHPH